MDLLKKLKDQFQDIVDRDEELLYLTEKQSYKSYLLDVKKYDDKVRNYFGVIKKIRFLLVLAMKYFSLEYFWEWFTSKTQKSWNKKRQHLDRKTLIYCFLPIVFIVFYTWVPFVAQWVRFIILTAIAINTLIYITRLLFLADIMNPSANISRSIFLISLNYLGLLFYFAYLFKFANSGDPNGVLVYLYTALGISGNIDKLGINDIWLNIMVAQKIVCFYFVGIIFVYFTNNFQARKFKG